MADSSLPELSTLKRAYNLLWIPVDFPADNAYDRKTFGALYEAFHTEPQPTEPFHQPIPQKTLENMLHIAEKNPSANVILWVDSKRLTPVQFDWLTETVEQYPSDNLALLDLRSIGEYNKDRFYNNPQLAPGWGMDKHSMIWRQVDSAKLLICLQGDYDQVFYSDGDMTNLSVDSEEVQTPLAKHGLLFRGGTLPSNGHVFFENQLFAFSRRRKAIFEQLYRQTIDKSKSFGMNGYGSYIEFIRRISRTEGFDVREVLFNAEHNGTLAVHPRGPRR